MLFGLAAFFNKKKKHRNETGISTFLHLNVHKSASGFKDKSVCLPLKPSYSCVNYTFVLKVVDFLVVFHIPMPHYDLKPQGLLEQVYECLETGVPLETLHIPHSDVYYVRAALYKHTGVEFSLAAVEDAMVAEGWFKNYTGD